MYTYIVIKKSLHFDIDVTEPMLCSNEVEGLHVHRFPFSNFVLATILNVLDIATSTEGSSPAPNIFLTFPLFECG